MTDNPPLRPGQILKGALFSEPMRVETVRAAGNGAWAAGLVGIQSERFRSVTLTARDLESLTILDTQSTYQGDRQLLRLGLQAYALGIAYEFALYFGLSISRIDPLPHQLAAVYDHLLKQARGPDFLRLANALSALYPRGSEEKRLLDAMLLAAPR